ncbi:hypothetical protein [Streptomyces celluloflavus]|uniref:hypothetical protein n=1 Tax=Streptomyces celluloflavus TaxID=58344 RepID=UPI0036CB3C35
MKRSLPSLSARAVPALITVGCTSALLAGLIASAVPCSGLRAADRWAAGVVSTATPLTLGNGRDSGTSEWNSKG